MRAICLMLLLAACGGPAARPLPEPTCAAERTAASDATEARDGCREGGGAIDDDERAYLVVRRALEVHAASVAASGAATEEGVMALSDGCWAYLDQVASHFTDHGPLDRAEDAVEALVRDRGADDAAEAAQGALAAIDAVHALVSGEGEASEPCAEEEEILHEATEALARCEGTASSAASEAGR
jgi:hypothetical protein